MTIWTDLAMNQRDERQESEGLAALKRYQILDSEPEPAFDRLTKLAASLFKTPIVTLTFAADGCVWNKSTVGLASFEHAGMSEFSMHAVERSGILVVEDASTNPQFVDNPLVKSAPFLRFYAGTPLITPNGQQIGTLSIADASPRSDFSATDADRLQDLAAMVIEQLEFQLKRPNWGQAKKKGFEFFTTMSHEIRTPMNGVLGMAELLLITDDLSDRHRHRVEIIKRSGENLLSMLDHIIELAKIETAEGTEETSSFDPLEIVHDIHNQFQSKDIGKTIELNLIKGRLDIIGDAPRFRKLFTYFLNSALATSAEGPIRIALVARPVAGGKIQARFEIKNANIDSDMIERMLATFERDDLISTGSFSETDLGLLICKKLCEAMGGDIGIDRLAGKDSVFWLEITLSGQIGHAASKEASTASVATEIRNDTDTVWDVLVAEDNPEMALLVEDLLEEAGYHVTVAPDGASVLRILGEQHIDVVLMDGRMPDMSGFETADLIRKLPDECAKVPIIALTADALAGDRERYLSAGMDDYVAKPVDYETLISAIERCCSEH